MLQADDYLTLQFNVEELPDRFSLDGGNSFLNMTEFDSFDPSVASHGDWTWDNVNDEVKFVSM